MKHRHPDPWDWDLVDFEPTFCLTFTPDADPQSVLVAYGVPAHEICLLDCAEADAAFDAAAIPDRVYRAGRLGTWAFCISYGGIRGTTSKVLRRLSADGKTYNVFRGGDGMDVAEHWRKGERAEVFEPLDPNTLAAGSPEHPFWDKVSRRNANHPDELGIISTMHVISDEIGPATAPSLHGELHTGVSGHTAPER